MYVGIHTASLPQVFAEAKRRIILHAALYSPFAASDPHREGLETALRQPGFKKMHAICLPFAPKRGWMQEFLGMLRPSMSIGEIEHEFNSSLNFLVRLAAQHEGMVEIYETRAMPCIPTIVVDDRIFFGHYAHSDVLAGNGYWFSVTAPVEELITYAKIGGLPKEAGPKKTASYRYIAECINAMQNAKRMLL